MNDVPSFLSKSIAALELDAANMREVLAAQTRHGGKVNKTSQQTLRDIETALRLKVAGIRTSPKDRGDMPIIVTTAMGKRGENTIQEFDSKNIPRSAEELTLLYWSMAQPVRLDVESPELEMTLPAAFQAYSEHFADQPFRGGPTMVQTMIASADQWLAADGRGKEMTDLYANIYEQQLQAPEVVSSLTAEQEQFALLISGFVAQLRAHCFRDEDMQLLTANGRKDCISCYIFHLENLARQFRAAKPVPSYKAHLKDPLIHHALYELLRDMAANMPWFADELKSFIEKIHSTSTERRQLKEFTAALRRSKESPATLFPTYQQAMDHSFQYYQMAYAALCEGKAVHDLRAATRQLSRFSPVSSHSSHQDPLLEAGVSLHAIVGAERCPTVVLSADRGQGYIALQQADTEHAVNVFGDGRVLHEAAPPYALSSGAESSVADAESLTQEAHALYESVTSTLQSLAPELLKVHPEFLNGCVIVREADQYHVLVPHEIAAHIPRMADVQEASEEEASQLLMRLHVDTQLRATEYRCLSLPTFTALEERYLEGISVDGEFTKGSDPSDGGQGGGAGGGGRSRSVIPRMHVLRNTLLANRNTVGRMQYAWDEQTTQSFSSVDPGRYTVVTLPDLGVQFVVSDDDDKAVYTLMADILPADQYAQQPITPSWLKSQGAQPLFWEHPLQFSRVTNQALIEREMTLSSRGYANISELVAAERSEIMRLFQRVAEFSNQHPGKTAKHTSADALTTTHFHRIASGDCGLYCGDAVLNHLIAKSGEQLSQGEILHRLKEEIFA